jgi:hypothetical protein
VFDMMVPGAALIRKSDSSVVASWVSLPTRLEIEGELRVDGVGIGWENEKFRIEVFDIEIGDPPDPGLRPPTLKAAAFNIAIANSDVSAIEGAFNTIAALYLGVGQFMLLFLEAEPDADYFAQITGGSADMRVTERFEDSLIIEAKDGDGEYIDPTSPFSVQTYRI